MLCLSATNFAVGQTAQQRSLTEILIELSRGDKFTISFSPTFTNDIYPNEQPLTGNMSNTLRSLLSGSGLAFTKVGENSYVIYKKDEPDRPPLTAVQPLPEPEEEVISKAEPIIIIDRPAPEYIAPALPEIRLRGFPSLPDTPVQRKIPRVAIKTNLLYDATATINVGVEIATGARTTLDVSGSYNNWTNSDTRKFRHWFYQPEFRLWNCERFNKGFWGVHAHYGQYNVGGKLPFGIAPKSVYARHRYEGWFVGAGISYGYHWMLGGRWAAEASVGAGYARLDYSKFECERCAEKLGRETKHYFGPTKLAVTLLRIIK